MYFWNSIKKDRMVGDIVRAAYEDSPEFKFITMEPNAIEEQMWCYDDMGMLENIEDIGFIFIHEEPILSTTPWVIVDGMTMEQLACLYVISFDDQRSIHED